MSSEGIQITIPDLDEDDFSSTSIPFGRAAAFGFGGSSNSGPESPTILTPTTTDKGFFGTHNRGDSLASDDSFLDHLPRKPFAHAPQPSIATSTTSGTTTISSTTGTAANPAASPFSKKSSFASIKNAFKSSLKSNADVPPLPSIDPQVYPILKNPFNRSTSSLAHSITSTSKHNATSPSHVHPRPPTPASGEPRHPRSLSRARGHAKARSHQSQSGSIFHYSDNGSDHGHSSGHHPPNHAFAFGHPPSSPPPVPRVPDGFLVVGGSSPAMSDDDLSVGISGGKSPSDYALHAVFMRFATLAEAKIDAFLHESLTTDPALTDYFAPSVDPQFDDLLRSLAKIGQRHAKNVVDAIMRWRRGIGGLPSGGPSSAQSRMAEPKSFASVYVMCRALISVLSSLPPQALGDALGYSLEETIFEQFKSPVATASANYRSCTELYATVLGCLARIRFVSVTDRFLNELAPVAGGQVAKDSDTKFENLVKGLRHVQLKVWPPEAFDECAEFMESLAKSFENTHGLRFKIAFAETIIRLLHPIGKTAQAEVNHPLWGKAIERIYPRAREMMGKPRYWQAAYPLAVTALCVAPHQFFLKTWTACFEYGIGKLKDKPSRIPIMNGVVRLIWTYLFRCQEPASTSTAKLDALLKQLFPPGRVLVYPNEEHLEPFICVIHLIFSRYFDFGRDFCMELLQESSGVLAPERVTVSVQAALLTLHAMEREDPTPTWPTSPDFSAVPSWDDYPSSSDTLPPTLLSKPGVQDFCERFGTAISTIVQSCFKSVGRMSVFDEQWALSRLSSASGSTSFEESHSVVIRRHPEGAVAYPSQLVSQISILQSCFQSWPRCLHIPSLSLSDAVDMLVRGVIHVEPRVGEAAGAALRRLMKDARYSLAVLKCFTAFLFDPRSLEREAAGVRMVLESTRLLNLWTSVVDNWISGLTHGEKPETVASELQTIATQARRIAASALFLLSHELSSVRCTGVKLMRSLQSLFAILAPSDLGPLSSQFSTLFQHSIHNNLQGFDELLDRAEFDRLQQWKKLGKPDVLLRIADSSNDKDRRIWRHIYPLFMRSSQSLAPHLVSECRAVIEAAVSRYHSTMLHLAGISGSTTRSQSSRVSEKDGYKLIKENTQLIDQWHIWIKTLSSTVTVSEGRPAMVHAGREHSRAPSDAGFERERTATSRNLFRHLTPFLDSDYAPFRDTAVLSISSFPPEAYSQLLEDLNSFSSRQFYDEIRPKSGSSGWTGRSRRQTRLHSAVARIYYLTSPHLQHPNLAAKQDALSHALKFVRNTQAFLMVPENRENHAHQRLRRYFCGLVERLFDALAALPNSDRFAPPNIHITLYRLVEEWCQYGPQSESVKQRFILMQRAAVAANNDPQTEAADRFQNETKLLSNATIGALAALCQKACILPDAMESTSPTEQPPEDLKPPDPGQLVERLHAVFGTGHSNLRASARKALKSLLTLPQLSSPFLGDIMRRSFCDLTASSPSPTAFFEVVADVICDTPDHPFTFPQVVTLGMANLCHSDFSIRRRAFDVLVATHERASGVIAMAEFEAMIVNPAPSVYLQAHRLIAECMAREHPTQAHNVLAEVSTLLLRIHHDGGRRVSHLMLQSLEHWMPHLHVQDEDPHSLHLTTDGSLAVCHLLALTKRYSEVEPEQIGTIWARLVEVPDPRCGRAVASFLVNESSKVATKSFVKCASEVIACLSRTAVGVQIFEELCSICEPERMLPTLDHRLRHLTPAELELWSDLDVLFTDDQPRYFLGSAQYAMLFIGSTALERLWTYGDQISAILLAVLSHIDHRVPMLRAAARRMLFQLMRSCVPWYPSISDKVGTPNRAALLSVVSAMESRGDSLFWTDEDSIDVVNARMEYVVDQILSIIGLFVPNLASQLGRVAIEYLDHCVIRSIAMRCLQVYRCLRLPFTQPVLGHILVRFTTMAGDQDSELHPFNAEIITTITASVVSGNFEPGLLPKIFWTAAACLMTVVEREFLEAVRLLTAILSRLDLEDADVAGSLLFQQPESWNASGSLQAYLLGGMRSATTMQDTFTAVQQLTHVSDSRLVEPSERRLCELFTLSLPWCLRAMVSDGRDAALDEFCMCIARLAEQDGRDSIARVMTSFIKNRFRTKDDFLRQSAATLREHYAARWTDISTLLLGLVLNKENWVRVHTMQVLKVFFQQRDLRSTSHCLTTEHLMPLLRLVEGDLAAQALDVLEEPNKVIGGPNARQVLRMSMHGALNRESADEGEIFGVPEESGWSVPHVDARRTEYRHSLYAVAQTCIGTWRPSLIRLESRGDIVSFVDGLDEDLGVLVQDLHDLSEFFQNGRSQQQTLLPSQQLEERVASIIARSTGDPDDAPHTPFADVFQIGNPHYFSDNSADDSGSDSEMDAFVFDSPAYYREGPNATHLG
ncbi:cell morphogenesis N-terminal-domain-containing protein [Pisolithus marmoratus]|nr:cell morphogenesis N-terminal-domain-containing protein [Pisolithus marmoratus]